MSADTSFIADHATLFLSVLRTGITDNRVFALDVRFGFTWHSHYYRCRVAGLQGVIPQPSQTTDSVELKCAVLALVQGYRF
jgi:hypothetical protein